MLVAVGRAAKNTGGLVLGYEVNGLCHRVNCMVSDDVALRRDNADGLALSSVIDRRLTVPCVHAGVPQRHAGTARHEGRDRRTAGPSRPSSADRSLVASTTWDYLLNGCKYTYFDRATRWPLVLVDHGSCTA